MASMSRFEQQTKQSLLRCAEWLIDHAEPLASAFSGGGKDWRLTFSAGDDGIFPAVNVHVEQSSVVVVEDVMGYGDGDE